VAVLAVDDDRETRELITTILGHHGATVVTARSTADAMAQLRGRRFDCVVTDLGMPVEDGVSLARRLQEDAALAALPIIALTAFARPVDRDTTQRTGFRAHVTKPVEPYELVRTIAGVVGRTGADAA
jgi:CheY-like chemotaxis protein